MNAARFSSTVNHLSFSFPLALSSFRLCAAQKLSAFKSHDFNEPFPSFCLTIRKLAVRRATECLPTRRALASKERTLRHGNERSFSLNECYLNRKLAQIIPPRRMAREKRRLNTIDRRDSFDEKVSAKQGDLLDKWFLIPLTVI